MKIVKKFRFKALLIALMLICSTVVWAVPAEDLAEDVETLQEVEYRGAVWNYTGTEEDWEIMQGIIDGIIDEHSDVFVEHNHDATEEDLMAAISGIQPLATQIHSKGAFYRNVSGTIHDVTTNNLYNCYVYSGKSYYCNLHSDCYIMDNETFTHPCPGGHPYQM